MPKASSCMFVLPRMTAPASTSFWTVGAFSFGTNPLRAGVPAVFGRPAADRRNMVVSLMRATPGYPVWSVLGTRVRPQANDVETGRGYRSWAEDRIVLRNLRRLPMARTYNVIDADGHILEPVDIWEKYIDPAYRERAPRMIADTYGK